MKTRQNRFDRAGNRGHFFTKGPAMKKIICLFATVAFAAGCQSTKPLPMPPATVREPSAVLLQKHSDALQQTLRDVQRSLDAATAAQQQSQAKLERAYAELHDRAVEIKAVKERVDVLQGRQQTNNATIAQLQEKLKATVKELNDVESQLSGSPAKLLELQKDLEKEKQQRDDAVELARQRDREIEDLRRALAAQQNLLKDNKKIIAADKTQPPVEAQPGGKGAYDDANKWVAQANNLLAEGKAEDAQTLFQAALNARPAMISALVGLGACQYQRGDYLGSAKTIDRVLDLDSKNAQALGVKGLVYRKSGELSAASSTLEKAVKCDPSDARLRNYFGIVLSDRKRTAEAIEQFRKAAEIDPGYSEAQFNLAFLLATAVPPRLDEAKDHYEKAVKLGAEHDADLEKILGGAK